MIPQMLLFSPFKKGFVRAHTRKGKQVGPYFTTRQKKVGEVKHTKKTRVDYSEKEAQLKIKLLHEKKKHHNLHVEAAKELKEKVDSHKAKGNTTFKIGDKHHDISKVSRDLNNHIEHHSNEVKSHDNHISKIQDRYKTDREYFVKKKAPKLKLAPKSGAKSTLQAALTKFPQLKQYKVGDMEMIDGELHSRAEHDIPNDLFDKVEAFLKDESEKPKPKKIIVPKDDIDFKNTQEALNAIFIGEDIRSFSGFSEKHKKNIEAFKKYKISRSSEDLNNLRLTLGSSSRTRKGNIRLGYAIPREFMVSDKFKMLKGLIIDIGGFPVNPNYISP